MCFASSWPILILLLSSVLHFELTDSDSDLFLADVDPAVLQRVLLVDLLLCCGRLPGGEKICRTQVHPQTCPTPCHVSLMHSITPVLF